MPPQVWHGYDPPPNSVTEGCLTPRLVPQPSWQLHPSAAGFSIFQISPHPGHSPKLWVHVSVATPTISLWTCNRQVPNGLAPPPQLGFSGWMSIHPVAVERISVTFFLNWSTVDLQRCIRIRCISKWLSYTYMYIHSFLGYFPISGITEYWVAFPVLYSK